MDLGKRRKWMWWALGAVALVGVAGLALALMLGVPGDGSDDREPGSSNGSVETTGASVPSTLSAAAAAVPPGGVVTLDAGEKVGKHKVLIFLWNDTSKRPLKDTVIKWGESGSWRVDPGMAAERATIGPFRTGRRLTLTVYPDGENGKGCAVPFLITSTMSPGSVRDGIHVEIRDDGVHVLGNPVDNFDRTYSRP